MKNFETHFNSPSNFQELSEARDLYWSDILSRSALAKTIMSGDFDKRLYAIYLIETYHYVIHNPRHQALVGVHAKNAPFNYVKFCYDHANEETGHEMMAFHDLLSLGLEKNSFTLDSPLNSTELLIGYLYYVSTTGNYLRRLGYSFWAEDSYGYIGELIGKVKEQLSLDHTQMTFLVSHSAIDEAHSAEIESMLNKYCSSAEDWNEVNRVMYTTLQIQALMLDEIDSEYQRIKKGEDSRYSFLNAIL